MNQVNQDEVMKMAFDILPENERSESFEEFKKEFTVEELERVVKFAEHFYQSGLAAGKGQNNV